MDQNEFMSLDELQQQSNAFAADAGTPDAKPKPKRAKKTIDQQIAEAEERLRKLKKKQRNEERAARTHRLVETGAVVEAALGIEFIEKEDRERLQRILTKRRVRSDGSMWTWAEAIAQAYNDSMSMEMNNEH